MKNKLAAAVVIHVLVCAPALAQQPTQKTYTIVVSVDQANVLIRGLLELTGKDMMPTWQAIMGQIQAQNNAPQPKTEAPKE